MRKVLFPLLAAATLFTGCATVDSGASKDEPREEKVYSTGSNIPKRQGSGDAQVYDREALQRARDQMPQTTARPGLGGAP